MLCSKDIAATRNCLSIYNKFLPYNERKLDGGVEREIFEDTHLCWNGEQWPQNKTLISVRFAVRIKQAMKKKMGKYK